MNDIIKKLHPLERKVLPVIKDIISVENIKEKTGLKDVEIHRALQWLEMKKLLTTVKAEKEIANIGVNGIEYLKNGFPEKRFLEVIKKQNKMLNNIKEEANLDGNEFNISLGKLKKDNYIQIEKGFVNITKEGKDYLKNKEIEDFLKELPKEFDKLNVEEKYFFRELEKRKDIVKIDEEKDYEIKLTKKGGEIQKQKLDVDLIENLNSDLIVSKKWKNKEFRHYDVSLSVGSTLKGKRHFVNQAKDYARRIWLDMGFKEMKSTMVQTSFWNFDALFTAQDHPVREMQDTFFIDNKDGKLPGNDIVNRVKKMHESGDKSSKGWQYTWRESEAKKNVLRTHTTCLSARTLANLTEKDIPGKFFAIGKNFRNETLDWKHLFEFNQTEGIVVDENVNFRHLLGYLKEFFKKMGFDKIRFRPAYFPYVSQSTEIDVFHPEKKEWIELGGAGIFRPEVVIPILGKDIPVLAWGPGFDRIILDYYKIQDIRVLYKNDIKYLREMKSWIK